MSEYKHWCGTCQIRVYFQRHYGKRLSWEDCPYSCEYAEGMRRIVQKEKGEKMADLIDRQELISWLSKDPLFPEVESFGLTDVIKSRPSVDAEPTRHGKWKLRTINSWSGKWYCGQCSECGQLTPDGRSIRELPIWNYCPNCGAKMDEVEE